MKDTFLYLKILLLMIITISCLVVSSIAVYHLIKTFSSFNIEEYNNYYPHDKGTFDFIIIVNVFLFLIPLLISLFSFIKLRSIYHSFSK